MMTSFLFHDPTHRARNRILVIVAALAVTAACVFIGGRWAISPVVDFSGGLGESWGLIEKAFPVHLVSPSWIKATNDDLIPRWNIAEFRARASLVFIAWLSAMVVFGRWEYRLRVKGKNETSLSDDHLPHGTA
jgi:hypothetical protein